MHGLGLLFALMGSLRGDAEPPRPAAPVARSQDPVEPLDDATYDAWSAWARGERRRWTDPSGPIVPVREAAPRGLVAPPERGLVGRI
jgi:hypothetical protein